MSDADMPKWLPIDPYERKIGWLLHSYLRVMTLPDELWDGTPAGAAEQLYELTESYIELWNAYEKRCGRGSLSPLLAMVSEAARSTADRWRADPTRLLPTDMTIPGDDRAERLHDDLSRFVEVANAVQEVLAAGGCWQEDETRTAA